MAQLFFEYGVMASGKSIEILKVAHNYAQQNRKVLLLTSSLDDRTKVGEVSSRVGLKHDANVIYQDTNLETYVLEMSERPEIVLIDEAQFMTREQVIQLTHIVDDLNIPVMAFGLKNDFSNHLFPGSEALLIFADKLEEIKTLDTFGTKKATVNHPRLKSWACKKLKTSKLVTIYLDTAFALLKDLLANYQSLLFPQVARRKNLLKCF